MDLVGADVLRDPAGLTGGDLGLANRVEQRRLPVVDVAHDRDDRRPFGELFVGVLVDRLGLLLLGGADDLDLLVQRLGQGHDRLVGKGLGERRHLAQFHQLLDHFGATQAQALGHLSNGGSRRDLRRLGLRGLTEGLDRRLFEERPASPSPTTPGRSMRRSLRHVLAA